MACWANPVENIHPFRRFKNNLPGGVMLGKNGELGSSFLGNVDIYGGKSWNLAGNCIFFVLWKIWKTMRNCTCFPGRKLFLQPGGFNSINLSTNFIWNPHTFCATVHNIYNRGCEDFTWKCPKWAFPVTGTFPCRKCSLNLPHRVHGF